MLVALCTAAVAGCAAAPVTGPRIGTTFAGETGFELAGRLSARRGNEAAAANFRWTHRIDRDELLLATPFGQTLAKLEGTHALVRLELPDGRVSQARDWEALTANVLGAPIPLRGLSWWVRGEAHPGSAHSIERDADARARVLRQDGWEIEYAYGSDGARPSRLRLAYPDVEIRLVLDSFGGIAAP